MVGYFKVIDKEGKEIGRYKYNAITYNQRRFLKSLKNITIYCCCGDEDIEMKISSDLKIYPANQNVGDTHEKGCPRYKLGKKEELWTIQPTETSIYYNVASCEALASDFANKINQLTYDRLLHPYRLPDNLVEFNHKCQGTLNYIKTANGDILQNISVVGKRMEDLAFNKEYFVYGMLKGKPIVKTYNGQKVLFLDVSEPNGFTRRYYANKEVYIEETSRLFDGSVNILVSGFAYKKSPNSKILTFSDFTVKAIDDLGVLISN